MEKLENLYSINDIVRMKISGLKSKVTIRKFILSGDLKAADYSRLGAKQGKLRVRESDLKKFLNR